MASRGKRVGKHKRNLAKEYQKFSGLKYSSNLLNLKIK